MRAAEIASGILFAAIALGCSSKGRGGGAEAGTQGTGDDMGGEDALPGSDSSTGVDASASRDGGPICATQTWARTRWSVDTAYLRLYAGFGRVYVRTWDVTNGERVFVTDDNGENWPQIGSAEDGTDVLSVAISNDTTLAGTWNALCRPDPGGTGFNPISAAGVPAGTAIWSLASIDGAFFAGTREDVYTSADKGVTWSEAKLGIPADAIVTSFVASGNRTLAGTDGSGVLVMFDGGTSWQTGDAVLANAYVTQLAVIGRRALAVTTAGLFVSDDDGSTWKADTSGLQNVNCLLVVDGALWAGTDAGGVSLSTDSGATWTAFSAGMPDRTRVWSLAATGGSIFAGTNSGIWRVSCDGP